MKNIKSWSWSKVILLGAAIGLSASALTACTSNADRASENISAAAENFEVNRKIVGTNTIRGEYVFEVEGRCSIERGSEGGVAILQAICKHGPDDYKRHEIGLADNVMYTAVQLDPVDVSEYSVRIELRPQAIIPDFRWNVGK